MNVERHGVEDQATLWNGVAGRGWVEAQALLDRMLQPFEDLLVAGIPAGSHLRVLDVGCGTGSTTLTAARRLGPQGLCVGIDISEPMLAAARTRAERARSSARFICDDAQIHPFDAGRFDTIVSRFGVMFFDEPVRAFANLRRAVREEGNLRFVAWRSAAENPFMTCAERAAAPLLPSIPPRRPDGPGQFAFADDGRVRRILDESAWRDVTIEPIDIPCAFPEGELIAYLTRVGPVSRVLGEMSESARTRIIDAIRPAFDPYVRDAEVRFDAACWMVDATAVSLPKGADHD